MSFVSTRLAAAVAALLLLAPIGGTRAYAQDHGDHSGGVHGGRGASHDAHSAGRGRGGSAGRRGGGSGHSGGGGGHHVPTGVGDDHGAEGGHDDGHDDHEGGSSHTSQGQRGGADRAGARGGRGRGGVAGTGRGGSEGRGRGGAGRRSSDDPKGRFDERGRRDALRPGGRPVWAQEGLPEAELGRLNVARAPGRVLDRALSEAVGEWSDARSGWYGLPLDDALARMAELEKGIRVESPLQNLGMYRALLSGRRPVPIDGDALELAAIFLGGASDKTIPIVPDTVVALNTILGVGDELSSAEVEALARSADRVREAILSAHGDPTGEEGGHGH